MLLTGTSKLNATHVLGAEITYKHATADSFDVTMKVYRDCNGVALVNTPVKFISACDTFDITLFQMSVRDVTGISPKCSTGSRCSGSYPYGVEEFVFQRRVRLPVNTCTVGAGTVTGCQYTLSWEQCCRNSIITTGPANTLFYTETKADFCQAPTNSSPEFAGLPTFFLPLGQQQFITHTAYDSDGDFLTYEQIFPQSGPGADITYSGAWTQKRPITFLGFPNSGINFPAGFRFDSLTSNMTFRPTVNNQVSVIAIRVKEWRIIGGVLTQIGEIIREAMVQVISMPTNKVPLFANADPYLKICDSVSGTYCFDIPVTDADASDTVHYSFTHNFPNATVNNISSNPARPILRVCITVDSAMLATFTNYQITISVNDSTCALPGKNAKTFMLKFGPPEIIFVPRPPVCSTTTAVPLLAQPPGGTWTGPGVTGNTFNPSVAGAGGHYLTYTFTDTSTSCTGTDSIWIRVVQKPVVDFIADPIGLPFDSIEFTNITTADTIINSRWNFGDGATSTADSPKHLYGDTGVFSVTLRVFNGTCPADSITKIIKIGNHYLAVQGVNTNDLRFYPNPADNEVHFECDAVITTLTLIDMLGRTTAFEVNSASARIDVSGLNTGVYLLEAVDAKGKVYTGKLLVER